MTEERSQGCNERRQKCWLRKERHFSSRSVKKHPNSTQVGLKDFIQRQKGHLSQKKSVQTWGFSYNSLDLMASAFTAVPIDIHPATSTTASSCLGDPPGNEEQEGDISGECPSLVATIHFLRLDTKKNPFSHQLTWGLASSCVLAESILPWHGWITRSQGGNDTDFFHLLQNGIYLCFFFPIAPALFYPQPSPPSQDWLVWDVPAPSQQGPSTTTGGTWGPSATHGLLQDGAVGPGDTPGTHKGHPKRCFPPWIWTRSLACQRRHASLSKRFSWESLSQ